jgi:hypothetical protein
MCQPTPPVVLVRVTTLWIRFTSLPGSPVISLVSRLIRAIVKSAAGSVRHWLYGQIDDKNLRDFSATGALCSRACLYDHLGRLRMNLQLKRSFTKKFSMQIIIEFLTNLVKYS